MISFKEFPDGRDYWLVKCIDRIRSRQGLTESASFDVLLQKIDRATIDRIDQVSPSLIASLFRFNPKEPREFRVVQIHAASLPAIKVGDVFAKRVFAGQLPSEQIEIDLPAAEKSTVPFQLDTQIEPKPTDWPKEWPFRILTSLEYWVAKSWQGMQVIVAQSNNRDVIIPRTVVFQRFYGPHSELADALTSGPWEEVRKRLVCDSELESGLRTFHAVEENEWHLVLQTLVPDAFRWHVALMEFDPYANAQVRGVYSRHQAQISPRKDFANCSATLPFDPGFPLKLRLKGYSLTSTKSRPNGAFLVTNILAASTPPYVPTLVYARANSGDAGSKIIEVDEPAPYGGKQETRSLGDEIPEVTVLHAPGIGADTTQMDTDTFTWDGKLIDRKQTKPLSKTYRGRKSPHRKAQEKLYSTAKPVPGGQGGSNLSIAPRIMPSVPHFQDLMDCLGKLKQKNRISSFNPVQPTDTKYYAERGGLPVWNLGVKDNKKLPRTKWRWLRDRRTIASPPFGRTILVVELKTSGATILLFEVEVLNSRLGYALGALAYPTGAAVDQDMICWDMIIAITDGRGKHMELIAMFVADRHPPLRGTGYRHRYASDEKRKVLSKDSLLRFLTHLASADQTFGQ